MTLLAPQLEAKRLDLLREVVPAARRIAMLSMHRKVTEPGEAPMRVAAARMGIYLSEFYVAGPAEFTHAFAAMGSARAEALVVVPVPEFADQTGRIVSLAVAAGLPMVCGSHKSAAQGCLIGYGPDQAKLCQRAAADVARVFRGASPSELPIEAPTRYVLTVNLKTATAFGLTVPQLPLAQADEVIE